MVIGYRLVLLVVGGGVPTLTLLLGTCICVAYCRKRRSNSQLDVAQAGTVQLSARIALAVVH